MVLSSTGYGGGNDFSLSSIEYELMVAPQAYVALLVMVANVVGCLLIVKSISLAVMSVIQGLVIAFTANCLVSGSCAIYSWLITILPLIGTILMYSFMGTGSKTPPAKEEITITPPPPPPPSMTQEAAATSAQADANMASTVKKEKYWQQASHSRATL